MEEDDSELLLERVEEEMAAVYSDDEDDHLLNIDDLRTLPGSDLVSIHCQKQQNACWWACTIIVLIFFSPTWNLRNQRKFWSQPQQVRIGSWSWKEFCHN